MSGTHLEKDGTVRQDHYGAGRQPWDDIKDLGWAPQFAAGNVLKYLRRTKEQAHSLESARWYWDRLDELSGLTAIKVRGQLIRTLTQVELAQLQERANAPSS